MKINILTFSKESNRGANIQAYSLMKTLKNIGCYVEFIDIQLPHKYNIMGYIYEGINNLCASIFRKKAGFKFSRKYKTIEELKKNPPIADLYIVGSDQVWNPEITSSLSVATYFFDFLPNDAKKISYAASFGSDIWIRGEYDSEVKRLLQSFDAVSVREESGVNICEKEFGVDNAVHVLDPSLFLTKEDIQKLVNQKSSNNNKVFTYLLYNSQETSDMTNYINSFFNIKVSESKLLKKIKAFYGVRKWLKQILKSEYIVTNSFHAMAMAIIMHKEVIVIPPYPGREARMISLLKLLGLENRYFKDLKTLEENLEKIQHIDYVEIEDKRSKLIKTSMNFLKSNIIFKTK